MDRLWATFFRLRRWHIGIHSYRSWDTDNNPQGQTQTSWATGFTKRHWHKDVHSLRQTDTKTEQAGQLPLLTDWHKGMHSSRQTQNKQDNWVYSQTLTGLLTNTDTKVSTARDRHKTSRTTGFTHRCWHKDMHNSRQTNTKTSKTTGFTHRCWHKDVHSSRQTDTKTEQAGQLGLLKDTDTKVCTAQDRHKDRQLILVIDIDI